MSVVVGNLGERWKNGVYNGTVAVGWCVRKHETGERILGQKANIEPLRLGFECVVILGDRGWSWDGTYEATVVVRRCVRKHRVVWGLGPKKRNRAAGTRFRAGFGLQQVEGGVVRLLYPPPALT
jgi:hypothetical protein